MRYGNPSVADEWRRLRGLRVRRLLLLPMYPQYSATTTASTFDAVAQVALKTRNLPEMRFVRSFHDHPAYIDALKRSVLAYWQEHGRPDKLIISFHGLPRRNLDLGDPYFCESHKTGRLLAQALDLSPEQFDVCFQSRFGKAQWLQPYTAERVRDLAKAGVGRLDVVCPGFVADCLETLEEIAQEARHDFLANGGKELRAIPCLNDDPAFIQALADVVEAHVLGWPTAATAQPSPADAQRCLERARALGASR
jgi:ferrochelatase